jgi:beta-galactosidase
MKKTKLRRNWRILEGFDTSFFSSKLEGRAITIPHNFTETKRNYLDETSDIKVMTYYYDLDIEALNDDMVHRLRFEGVAHKASVYLGHEHLKTHVGGYVPFEVDLTKALNQSDRRRIFVVVDARDTLNIPPFGHVIDFLTYGGIYRDVYLLAGHKKHIEHAYIRSFNLLTNPKHELIVRLSQEVLLTIDLSIWSNETQITRQTLDIHDTDHVFDLRLPTVKLWDFDEPILYTVKLTLKEGQQVYDHYSFNTGFRDAVFKKDGFYLNGKRRFLIGLNRHMSFPNIGYAMTQHGQFEDARILKEELGLNVIRSSHYPPSSHFIDACDELGIALIEEIPGWQHIGDEEWQATAYLDLEKMIERDKHHPSIVLWGVRINESEDDDRFYGKMNRLAHTLDPTRQTTGVRFRTKSRFLEDVYGFNDFSYSFEKPLMNPDDVTLPDVPLFISEHTGHMYPVKSFDHESRHIELIEKHLRIIDYALSNKRYAGVIGWCAFDYQTHQDFGSGDNMCHHGVMDMNRMPKQAYYAYAAEFGNKPILHIVNQLQNGDYPGGHVTKILILTNLDYVKVYRNDDWILTYRPNHEKYPNLAHPPIECLDLVGNLLETKEGLSQGEANRYKALYRALVRDEPHENWVYNEQDIEKAWTFYAKYVSNWGSKRVVYRFDGYREDQLIKTVTRTPSNEFNLAIDEPRIHAGFDSDGEIVRVPIVVRDENGHVARYLFEPIEVVSYRGVERIHDHIVSLHSGQTAIYVRVCSKNPSVTVRWRNQYQTWYAS